MSSEDTATEQRGPEAELALLTKAAVRYLDLTRHGEDLGYMDDPERAAVERAAHRARRSPS